MFVYLITNTVNNKLYVGKTERNISTRWAEHVSGRDKYKIQNAIRKYGKAAFSVEVLSIASTTGELSDLEKLWILVLRTFDDACGYNMTFGGDGGTPTIETRALISTKLKGRSITWRDKITKTLIGRKLANETKLKMRQAIRPPRRPHSTETRLLMAERRKGKGKVKRSEETKKRMSESRKLVWQRPEYRAHFTPRSLICAD